MAMVFGYAYDPASSGYVAFIAIPSRRSSATPPSIQHFTMRSILRAPTFSMRDFTQWKMGRSTD